jgi:transcriptional regulator with XRE-family HTH domain
MGNVRDEIAKNILYYRKKAGMTQKELADAVGAKKSSVSNWELAQNSPDIDTFVKVCTVLGVSVSDVFGVYSSKYESITPHERTMLDAYRARPEMQEAVDTLLGIK